MELVLEGSHEPTVSEVSITGLVDAVLGFTMVDHVVLIVVGTKPDVVDPPCRGATFGTLMEVWILLRPSRIFCQDGLHYAKDFRHVVNLLQTSVEIKIEISIFI